MVTLLRTLYGSCMLLLCMFLLTGFIYPALVTAIAQMTFPYQAGGSLIIKEGKTVGSELLGQSFSEPQYFFGRPSATIPPYNAASSAASNWSPGNPDLQAAVKKRSEHLKRMDTKNTARIPVDLLTASASGLDPHISVEAAEYQISRVAKHRKMTEQKVRELVNNHTENDFLWYGASRVNVLLLNLDLDKVVVEKK